MNGKKKKVKDSDWDIEDEVEAQGVHYQVVVPKDLHEQVMAKSKTTGIKIAPFVRQVFRDFLKEEPGVLFERFHKMNKKEIGQ